MMPRVRILPTALSQSCAQIGDKEVMGVCLPVYCFSTLRERSPSMSAHHHCP
jgi:hypothetical protein